VAEGAARIRSESADGNAFVLIVPHLHLLTGMPTGRLRWQRDGLPAIAYLITLSEAPSDGPPTRSANRWHPAVGRRRRLMHKIFSVVTRLTARWGGAANGWRPRARIVRTSSVSRSPHTSAVIFDGC